MSQVLFFGQLRQAQGNGAVFRTDGYNRHRRQWVNVSFTLSVECDATIFSRTFFTKSHDDIEAKIHTGIVFVLTARIQEC